MLTVFLKTASIFCMVAVGYLASKKNVLPAESNQYLVNLILTITNPCLIISSMSSQTLSSDTVRQACEILIGATVFFLAAAGVSFLIVKALHYEPFEDRGVMMVVMTAINTGFMGFPITKAIFGDHFFFLMVIQNIILNIYLYFGAILQMNYGHRKKTGLMDVIRPLLNNNTYALLIGLSILITRFQMPAALFEFFDTIANATIPVSMIVVGIQLAGSDLKKVFKDHKLMIACLANVVLMPILTFLAVNWLPLMNESKLILVFAACFPCAVISTAMAAKEGKNASLVAEGVAVTTLFSMATLPAAAMILMELYL